MDINEVFRKIDNAKATGEIELDLSGYNLKFLPEIITELEQLLWLDLDGNHLNVLPHNFNQLVNLRRINLSNNNFDAFPTELLDLKQLRRIDFLGNKLEKIPKEIGKLTNLETLSLRSNKLKTIPIEIGSLVNLHSLYLGDNKLESLPSDIFKLNKLTTLGLIDNNLKTLSQEISNLHNLRVLNLRRNKLESIPDEIANLPNLNRLYISGNKFNRIPESIRSLSSITNIDMGHIPIVFISYSYDSEDHKSWVERLATDLNGYGIYIKLDQWDVGPGDLLPKFMLSGIHDSNKVIMVCSENYIEKIDGGTGYEKEHIDADMLENIGTNKYIPIIRNNETCEMLPSMKGRVYVNLNSDDNYKQKIEKLAKHIHGHDFRPPLGSPPK